MYKELYALEENIFKTLANQKRLEIIHLLSFNELNVSDLASMTGTRQANISQHLSILRQANIVSSSRDGHTVTYKLTDSRIAKAAEIIRDFLRQSNVNTDAMQDFLEQEDSNPIQKDPVCGMTISKSIADGPEVYKDLEYYFCASGCKKKFIKAPYEYAKN